MMATSTATLEVPKDRWRSFLDEFSQLHLGWQTTIEVMRKDLGDQLEAEKLPLQGISYDTAGTGAGDVEIGTGDRPDDFDTFRVAQVRRVLVADTKPGGETDVEFVSADGTRTLVHLRPSPALPPK
jgi:hypothetical protein